MIIWDQGSIMMLLVVGAQQWHIVLMEQGWFCRSNELDKTFSFSFLA